MTSIFRGDEKSRKKEIVGIKLEVVGLSPDVSGIAGKLRAWSSKNLS